LLARGNVYSTKGDFNHAIADYIAAAQTSANAAPEYGNRGTAIATLSKPEYNQAIAIVFRGIAWMRQREFDAAIADFSQAISLDSNYTPTLVNRCMAHRLKGEFDRAIEDLSA